MTGTRTGHAVCLSALVCAALAVATGPRPRAFDHPQTTTTVTAESVARRMQDRDLGRDSRSAMRMTLYDRHNRVRERALTILTLRGRDAPVL